MDIVKAVLIFLKLIPVSAWRPFSVSLQNISYEIFQPQIYDMNVTVRNQTVDIQANVVRDISRPFIQIELLQDSGQRNFDLVQMNRTIDGCKFLNNRKLNIFFEIAYRALSKYNELPKRCPFRKKHYKFVNVTTDPEMLPPFLPDHRVLAKGIAWIEENGKKIFLAKGSVIIVVERVFKNNRHK